MELEEFRRLHDKDYNVMRGLFHIYAGNSRSC
jgi:hypothetical protein